MNELILIALMLVLIVALFVVYPWCTKDKNETQGSVSKIRVEVWYLDEITKEYKFLEEVSMEEWVKDNKRLISEIDPEMAKKYMSANWIAWKFDTALPLPAAELFLTKKGSRLSQFCKVDLSGPYGFALLDEQFVR